MNLNRPINNELSLVQARVLEDAVSLFFDIGYLCDELGTRTLDLQFCESAGERRRVTDQNGRTAYQILRNISQASFLSVVYLRLTFSPVAM